MICSVKLFLVHFLETPLMMRFISYFSNLKTWIKLIDQSKTAIHLASAAPQTINQHVLKHKHPSQCIYLRHLHNHLKFANATHV